MPDRLAVSTNTYHSYSLEEALEGIAAAGFRSVELSSVPGWTEHVPRNATDADLEQRLSRILRLRPARYAEDRRHGAGGNGKRR